LSRAKDAASEAAGRVPPAPYNAIFADTYEGDFM